MKGGIILTLILGVCFGSNFVVNGDFEDSLAVGWTEYSPSSYGYIARSTTYDPDSDYEVCVYRQGTGGLGTGYDKLYQIVDLPITNLDFSIKLKLYAYESGNGSNWCGAACALYYRDTNDVLLGVTRICRYTGGTPWYNSSTSHIIVASDTNWHTYTFNIEQELQNLSGVDPAEVAKVTVTLIDTAYNC
ncbi:MAG TPA: hypothetical protein ENI34_00890 [candidate division WOR-3 bacterium]|uniref:Uncharacterized protein n=1 Tax=candidate division WOR-3 bacterium TaxID=2052148 RepID=A0A9C9JZ30_UNCW3|nr:hypothetical protein [candidate division WOR-3 bacterium]